MPAWFSTTYTRDTDVQDAIGTTMQTLAAAEYLGLSVVRHGVSHRCATSAYILKRLPLCLCSLLPIAGITNKSINRWRKILSRQTRTVWSVAILEAVRLERIFLDGREARLGSFFVGRLQTGHDTEWR